MNYHKRVLSQLARRGEDATVMVHAKGETDAFGNPESGYTDDRTITVVRTYMRRNRESKSVAGDLPMDRPVFIVANPIPGDPADQTPEPPGEEDHLRYNGTEYAIQGKTEYETHIEYTASRLTDDA